MNEDVKELILRGAADVALLLLYDTHPIRSSVPDASCLIFIASLLHIALSIRPTSAANVSFSSIAGGSREEDRFPRAGRR